MPRGASESANTAARSSAGRRLGVRGTPTIVTEGGDTIGGYVPYRELVEMLEQG